MLRRLTAAFGYLLASSIVVFGTILLIAYGNGYNYDFKTSKLTRSGLVILQTAPTGASITIDGRLLKNKTPYRKSLLAGHHTVVVSKDGYRTWRKDIAVTASEVSLAQYIILYPNSLSSSSLTSFTTTSAFKPSPDRRKIAVIAPSGPDAGLWAVDVSQKTRTRLYSAKPATDTDPAETLVAITWSQDNSHLLLQSSVGAKPVFYVIAANGNDPVIDVSDIFKFDFPGLVFNPSNWKQLYWNSEDGLRRLDINNQTISAVLAEHVVSFGFTSDRVMYVDGSKSVRSLWLLDKNGHRTQVAAQIPEGQTYTLDYATFLGTPQIALSAQPAGTTVLYTDILSGHVMMRPLRANGLDARFNPDGRYIVQPSATSVATYDVPKGIQYEFPLSGGITNVDWFDGYHVLFDLGGKTYLTEFDGTNRVIIGEAGIVGATNTNDGKSVISFGPSTATGSAIRVTKLQF